MVVRYALDKNKVPALTETGLEKITNPTWYTTIMWNNMRKDSVARKIAYFLVWRNAHKGHFYAPYPGHNSVPDFIKFFNDPNSLFEKDLPNMYKVE
jgi:mannan endo-1,4-beta-mannosidase